MTHLLGIFDLGFYGPTCHASDTAFTEKSFFYNKYVSETSLFAYKCVIFQLLPRRP